MKDVKRKRGRKKEKKKEKKRKKERKEKRKKKRNWCQKLIILPTKKSFLMNS